jgi:hypothetical protein
MWKRDTYHNCAHELQQASDSFREAIARGDAPDSQGTSLELEQSSKDGVNLLKIPSIPLRVCIQINVKISRYENEQNWSHETLTASPSSHLWPAEDRPNP